MHRFPVKALALLTLLVVPVLAARSGGHHCQRCGCEATCCQKVCRLVTEPKKEPCYSCKCEDVCIPGPSKHCGTSCEQSCDGCCVKVHHWIPTCGTVRTKKVLVKTEVETCKLNYKWVVEYVCPQCANQGGNCTQGISQNDLPTSPEDSELAPVVAASETQTPRVMRTSFFTPLLEVFR